MSLSQAEIKKVRSLRTKKGRRTHGLFVAEGVRLLEESLRLGAKPEKLYACPAVLSPRGATLIGRARKNKIDVLEVSAKEIDRMADAETSPGIMAVFAVPSAKLAELYDSKMRNILLCENLSDPGNAGTLIRSAIAFGFDLVVLAGHSCEPYAPKVVRSSVGAVFGIKIAIADTVEVLKTVKDDGWKLITGDVHGQDHIARTLDRAKGKKLLLALGSEAEGVSPEVAAAADFAVRLNHEPAIESLNTAVAGSILMRECYRYRHRRTR